MAVLKPPELEGGAIHEIGAFHLGITVYDHQFLTSGSFYLPLMMTVTSVYPRKEPLHHNNEVIEAYPGVFNVFIIKPRTVKEIEHSNRKEQIYSHLLKTINKTESICASVTLNNSIPFPILQKTVIN